MCCRRCGHEGRCCCCLRLHVTAHSRVLAVGTGHILCSEACTEAKTECLAPICCTRSSRRCPSLQAARKLLEVAVTVTFNPVELILQYSKGSFVRHSQVVYAKALWVYGIWVHLLDRGILHLTALKHLGARAAVAAVQVFKQLYATTAPVCVIRKVVQWELCKDAIILQCSWWDMGQNHSLWTQNNQSQDIDWQPCSKWTAR